MSNSRKTGKVNVIKQVKLGKWRLKPVVRKDGHLVLDYVRVNGQPEYHPEGSYFLQWRESGRVRTCVVPAGEGVEAAARQKWLELRQPRPERPTITEARDEFLKFVSLNRRRTTWKAYRNILERFQQSCKKVFVDEVTRSDMRAFVEHCLASGLSGRTAYDNLNVVLQFFKRFGRTGLAETSDRPKFFETIRPVYEPEEILALLEHASEEESLMISFLLASGFRDREFQCVCWRDVDFRNCTVRVTAKPALRFIPKSWEERAVPLPKPLIERLLEQKQARNATPSQLVFPNSNNRPQKDGNRIIKSIAYRAGLNCGQCVTKFGNKCADWPHCTHFFMQKFRHTFATEHLRDGVDICSLQQWMGHSDLASTMVYLKGLASSQAVEKVSKGWLSSYTGGSIGKQNTEAV